MVFFEGTDMLCYSDDMPVTWEKVTTYCMIYRLVLKEEKLGGERFKEN